MSEVGVMHILDSLALGGAERAAVNLVNGLPRENYRPYLCTTRREGPLREVIAEHVGRIALERNGRFDFLAIRRLVDFIRLRNIVILHAHGSSLFIASLAAWFPPYPAVIWHAHYGRFALEDRGAWAHRVALRSSRGVITVNQQLARWCARRLNVRPDKIWCIPNIASVPPSELPVPDLPGTPGSRITCVANLREEKDHLTLVRAMALVVQKHPTAHLLLVGAYSDPVCSAGSSYFEAVKQEVARNSLCGNITFLGQRRDIPAILHGSDIGVLSSKTEGLPVSLLEYGAARLPVVATRVGDCEEVLDGGRAGLLVPPQSPGVLAEALLSLLGSSKLRTEFGERFLHRVQELYSAKSIIKQVCCVYQQALQPEKTELARGESAQYGFRA